jgi:non-canonical poly(A) RNA polymerase PAPD5/7
MAFRTLTNPKIIMDLGPSRSILGTIIRPDSVLLERKGGSNGEVTFNSLLPGAGEPLHQSGDQQGILCNWQVDEEELLPRGNGMVGETSHSSGKKRKASSKEKSGKKVKNKQEAGKVRQEENGSMGEKGTKKKHANGFGRHNHRATVGFGRYNRDANGYGHYGGESSWTR